MFRRLPDSGGVDPPGVPVTVDGHTVRARVGDSVATVLLLAGRIGVRTATVSGAPRGPYCLMGACFDCAVTIDDQPNRQACLVTVAPGMRVETARGAR